jgi:hypothetical protein
VEWTKKRTEQVRIPEIVAKTTGVTTGVAWLVHAPFSHEIIVNIITPRIIINRSSAMTA